MHSFSVVVGLLSACAIDTTRAATAPSCASIGQSGLCADACTTGCYGASPAFTRAGCVDSDYCGAGAPAWSKGATCVCSGGAPATPPPHPSCASIGQSGLCADACTTGCYGASPAFTRAGCVDSDYCGAGAPAWSKGATCVCSGGAPATPPPQAPPSTPPSASTTANTGASAAPSCASIGQSGLCADACTTGCYGASPAFTIPGCVTSDYCAAGSPAWSKGSACVCSGGAPATPPPTAGGGGQPPQSLFLSSDYKSALHLVTKFYGAQRSGTQDANWLIRQFPTQPSGNVAGKGVCFPEDGKSHKPTADYSGGWHDAGDFIKFTNNIAWSAYVLLKSFDAFPAAHADRHGTSYGPADGVPDVLNEVKWATDYLVRIHDISTGALATQIGDYRDHNAGLTCPTMTVSGEAKGGGRRTVWFGASETDTTQSKADVLATTAATLALMAKLYAPFDAGYAATCTAHAKKLYSTAMSRPGNTAEAPNQNYYAHNSWKDDMACAAVELHRVVGAAGHDYGADAVAYSKQVGAHGWVVDWSQHIDYCRHSMAVAGLGADVRPHWKHAIDSYKGKISSNQYVKGLAFFSDWGSLRYAANAAFSAALYGAAFGDDAATAFARSQADYILGNNGYQRSFVVGWGTNPPTRPHHKNAWGRDAWFGASSVPLYSLDGALVGGPHTNHYADGSLTSPPGYTDTMQDYICNEVTLDYNSGLVGLLAALTSTPAPPAPASTTTAPSCACRHGSRRGRRALAPTE